MTRPIALLTDFGLKDHYAGSLKGIILRINPKAVIFDITHDIRPQNIRDGAFVLHSVYPVLPEGTVVVAVVDPGVGSMRQAICIKTKRGFLIAPNNGILSMVLEAEGRFEARLITNSRYFHKPVSSTFHGRDIFAPVSAWLSKKDIFRSLGPVIRRIHCFPVPKVHRKGNSIHGEIIYIDRFGNAMTNISRTMVGHSAAIQATVISSKRKIRIHFKSFFSAGMHGTLIAVWNSGNTLELALRDDSAEKRYGLKLGDSVTVRLPS